MAIENNIDLLSDEEYVVSQAKYFLKNDPITAKAWMITATTLYPNNFSVQFEAYCVEKNAKNIKEAAKCLSDIIRKFEQHPDLWKEIDEMTTALRLEPDSLDLDKKFLCDMFQYIPLDIQHQILLFTADHCEDTMEHCRLLLLLIKRFPSTVDKHGPKLIDTLMTAEKHSHIGNQSINPFRRLLVCELLPLIGSSSTTMDLPSKLLYKLLNKAMEFYLSYVSSGSVNQDPEQFVEQPWTKLFSVLELTGRILGWDSSLLAFSQTWNKEFFWQKIVAFLQQNKAALLDENIAKQFLYSVTLFFLYCLHEYTNSQWMTPSQTPTNFILLECFSDPTLPKSLVDTKSNKRRRVDDDANLPLLTIDPPGSSNVLSNFLMACNCWETLHSNEILQKDFLKLTNNLKIESSLNSFILDFAIYKGHYEDALARLQISTEPNLTCIGYLRKACIYYFQGQYAPCFEHVILAASKISKENFGLFSNNLTVAGTQRHLHFLPLTYKAMLQYCTSLLINGILENLKKNPTGYHELALGNLLVLIQLDWPQQEEILPMITTIISQHRTFNYLLFQKYVINVEILEELLYLCTPQGGNALLEIFVNQYALNQRRIGTRGADKEVKEDFKQSMRRQVLRSIEPIDQVVLTFITQERIALMQSIL